MIKKVLLLVLLCSFFSNVFAQKSVNDYSYVVVPKLYEFLYENDQYQLNSLTKFLFNKHGFNAYFISELPNVKRCDGLYADVISNSSFVYTRISIVLKDCYGTEVFRSTEGKSKHKEYRKAYHQSLRRTFESIERLQANQKDIIDYDDSEINDEGTTPNYPVINEMKRPPVEGVDKNAEMTISAGTKISGNIMLNLPEGKFSSYEADGKSYLLRKTSNGYSFYEESEASETGLLLLGKIVVEGKQVRYTAINGMEYSASFNNANDLTIASSGTVKLYKAVH